jgi:dihydrofolate reductase
MRRITGAVFLSLDGVMQAPGGPSEDYTGWFDEGGWLFRFGDDGIFDTIGSLFAGDYDLLLGRRTYDIFAACWPYVEGDGAEMGRAFTRAGKHVLTRGDQPLEWENSYRLGGIDDVAAILDRLAPTRLDDNDCLRLPAIPPPESSGAEKKSRGTAATTEHAGRPASHPSHWLPGHRQN